MPYQDGKFERTLFNVSKGLCSALVILEKGIIHPAQREVLNFFCEKSEVKLGILSRWTCRTRDHGRMAALCRLGGKQEEINWNEKDYAV